jgi:hypothetical protein
MKMQLVNKQEPKHKWWLVEYIQLCSQWQLVVRHKSLAIGQIRLRLVRQLELLQLARRTRQLVIQQQVGEPPIFQQLDIQFFPRCVPGGQFHRILFLEGRIQYIFPKQLKEYIQSHAR